jgi:hypothetical protein
MVVKHILFFVFAECISKISVHNSFCIYRIFRYFQTSMHNLNTAVKQCEMLS